MSMPLSVSLKVRLRRADFSFVPPLEASYDILLFGNNQVDFGAPTEAKGFPTIYQIVTTTSLSTACDACLYNQPDHSGVIDFTIDEDCL